MVYINVLALSFKFILYFILCSYYILKTTFLKNRLFKFSFF